MSANPISNATTPDIPEGPDIPIIPVASAKVTTNNTVIAAETSAIPTYNQTGSTRPSVDQPSFTFSQLGPPEPTPSYSGSSESESAGNVSNGQVGNFNSNPEGELQVDPAVTPNVTAPQVPADQAVGAGSSLLFLSSASVSASDAAVLPVAPPGSPQSQDQSQQDVQANQTESQVGSPPLNNVQNANTTSRMPAVSSGQPSSPPTVSSAPSASTNRLSDVSL